MQLCEYANIPACRYGARMYMVIGHVALWCAATKLLAVDCYFHILCRYGCGIGFWFFDTHCCWALGIGYLVS